VIDSGVLSNYLGAPHENFYGGRYARECEAAWADSISAAHALAFNSNTSGLIAAMGAIGVGPGDEVIVTAYSMSISAVAPLFYGATPIFADVETDTFCLDPASIEAAITDRTKAIIIVDIFGQPFNGPAVRALADKHNLKIVEDCAQAPNGNLNGTPTGLLGDIGVFSLNYHKHIHSGEGGIVVTNDEALAQRMAMLRNHGECVVGAWGVQDLTNMIGHNMRMTEIEAVIATSQLGKLDALVQERLDRVTYFEEQMRGFEPMTMPKVRDGARHVYYVHACLWDTNCGTDRNAFVDAVRAELPVFELREKEGVKLGAGYVRPIYLLPMFENRMALQGPANGLSGSWQDYAPGLCPVVEDLHYNKLLSHEFIVPSMERKDIDDVVSAFSKVWDARRDLQKLHTA
jgi:dTDP-4-amino-4,6-dideoxygalactose transaminase